jgi:hypothetical protein
VASDIIAQSACGDDAGCQPATRQTASLRYKRSADWQSAVSRTGSPLGLDFVFATRRYGYLGPPLMANRGYPCPSGKSVVKFAAPLPALRGGDGVGTRSGVVGLRPQTPANRLHPFRDGALFQSGSPSPSPVWEKSGIRNLLRRATAGQEAESGNGNCKLRGLNRDKGEAFAALLRIFAASQSASQLVSESRSRRDPPSHCVLWRGRRALLPGISRQTNTDEHHLFFARSASIQEP